MLQKLSKGPYLIMLMALFFAFNFLLYWVSERKMAELGLEDVRLLDLHPGFTPDQAYDLLELLGPEGRAAYQMVELTMDMIYPIIYSLLLAVLLVFLFKKVLPPNCPCQRWTLLPFAGAIFDFLENSGIAMLIHRYPERFDGLASMTSLFGVLKWSVIVLSLLFILAALIAWAVKVVSVKLTGK